MGRKKKEEIPFWAKLGHQKPTTRREFLATGMIPFLAWGVGPSLATLLNPERAFGQTLNCDGAGTNFIPFITLNLSGGPSLASQVVAKTLAGANLSTYTRLGQGLGPGVSYNVITEFQGVPFAGTGRTGNVNGNVSKFLTGVQAQGTRVALDKTAFIWQAVSSADDTAMNPFDITGLVIKMGLQGSKLPNLGRTDTKTGINQQSAQIPPPAPFVVSNVNDLTNALGYAAAFAADPSNNRPGLSTNQKAALARVISRFSSSQIRRLASTPAAEAVTQIVECAGIRNIDLVTSGGGDVNPLAANSGIAANVRTGLTTIWGANANQPNSQASIFASMVYNGLVGNASTINLNLGGYDYHDNTRTTGDGRDLAAGQIVGNIIATAALVNKPVFIYVCADGATVSAESTTPDSAWTSDRGIAGMQFMLAFHPTARPATSGFQIGGFNNGQAADGSFPTGNNADLAAQAVFANYAAWNNRMDFLEQYRIAGDNNLRNQVIKLNRS